MILVVTPNPCIDKTLYLPYFHKGEIIRSERYRMIPGGKGNNVARVLKNLSIPVKTINILGGENGDLVKRMIKEQDGIDTVTVQVSGMTREIMTILDESDSVQTAFVEPGSEVNEKEREKFLETFYENLNNISILAVCGSSPNNIMDDAFYDMVKTAKAQGIRIMLDSRGNGLREGIKAGPDIIKPNIAEAEEYFCISIRNEKDIVKCLEKYKNSGVSKVILTAGRKGFYVLWENKVYFAGSPVVNEVNPIGSGDALAAAVLYSLKKNFSVEEMLRWAGAAGAANAGIWDACYCTKNDISELLPEVTIRDIDCFY